MKKLYAIITVLSMMLTTTGFTFAIGGGDTQELPIFLDFELFNGVNLHEVYPGWNQGKGLPPTPSTISNSAWFRSDKLYETVAAGVIYSTIGEKNEWIISPRFEVTETTKLTFMAALTHYWDDPIEGFFSPNDSVTVMVATEGYQFNESVYAITMHNQPGWEPEYLDIDLSVWAGQTIRIAFYATNGQQYLSQAAFHLDDIMIKDAVMQDAMALDLFHPAVKECFTESTPVVARIKNDGLESISSVPVRVRVRGAVTENLFNAYSGTIQPGEYADVEVGVLQNPPYGEYVFEIETELPGDGFPLNNKKSGIHRLFEEPRTLPLPQMNFIGFYTDNLGVIYPGWYEARGRDYPRVTMNTDWQGANYDNARTANVYFGTIHNYQTDDWMVGPKFTATEQLTVELRAAVEYGWNTNQMGESHQLALMISADCGQTWEEAAALTHESGLTASLQEFSFPIEGYGDQDIILAFYATSGDIHFPAEFYIHITDIEIKSQYDFDAGVTHLLSPVNSCSFTDYEEVTVRIGNFGSETISNFQVAYVLNGQDEVVETIAQSLAYGETLDYVFSQTADLTGGTQHYISVYTLLENDEYPENDGLHDVLVRLSSFDLTSEGAYLMGFEEDEDFDDWHVEDGNNDGITWELVQDGSHANTGEYSYAYFSNQSSVPSNDWLFSPCFNLEAGETYYVSFYYKNRATLWPESLRLKLGNAATGSAMDQLLIDLGEISNSAYLKAETTFTVDESGEYYFGWHAYGPADQFGMHIDDITIYQVFEYDLAAVNYVRPRAKDENCMLQPTDAIDVQISNMGEENISGFTMGMMLNDSEPLLFNFNESIAAGESLWLTLANGFLIQPDQMVDITIWTQHPNDINMANDTIQINDYLMTQYYTSFEAHEDTDDWVAESLAGVNQWHQLNNPSVARTGDYVFAIRTDFAGGNTANDDWLYSECFYLEAGTCYEVSFYYRSHFSTENLALYLGDAQSHTAMDELLINLPSFNSNNYLHTHAQFTVEESGVYYFGWHTHGGTSGRYFIYIDDVAIVEDLENQPVADPQHIILDTEVAFFANAENASSFLWDFGDGNTSEEEDPFHIYAAPGEYNVTLTVGSGCVDVSYTFDVELLWPQYVVMFDITDQQGNAVQDAVISVNGEANEAGNYVFELYPGGYQYVVEKAGYSSAAGNFTVVDEELTIQVQIEFEGALYSVVFQIEDQFGESLTDAVISLDGQSNDPGDYAFHELLPGIYEYIVSRACYISSGGVIEIINEDIDELVVLGILPGDANDDGVVDVLDVIAMVLWYLELQPDPFCLNNADINGDGIVDVLDIIETVTIFSRQ